MSDKHLENPKGSPSAARKGIRLPKATDMVADLIRQSILSGELKPGDKLPSQNQLTVEYGVSRPTLREAMRILEAERLITTVRGALGGAIINGPDPDLARDHMVRLWRSLDFKIDDIFGVRNLIEPAIVYELSSVKPSEAQAVLTACLADEVASANDPLKFARATTDFHRAIIRLYANEPLINLMESINVTLERALPLNIERFKAIRPRVSVEASIAANIAERRRLIDFIAKGMAIEAMTCWKGHLNRSQLYWIMHFGNSISGNPEVKP